jgi:excisionase family DNA binding protein
VGVSRLLSHEEAADRIGVGEKTLRQLRKQGLIRYVAVTGRLIKYRPEDCDAFVESRLVIDEPCLPTQRRGPRKRLSTQGNVVSFMARRRDRQAAGER